DEDVVFYNSRAMVEHSLALSYGKNGQLDSARAALGRSIGEDLSYFMAHVELGRLALGAKDTVTAVSELALAADLAVDEPYIHYLHGSVLLSAGQAADAIAPLRKAIELEPLHAASHFELAQALERSGDKAEARASYQRFLTMAPRREVARRAQATERVAGLQP
ncbi:MAG: tetratricopeptide repeat protein, partial [Gemmatimonadaceae bacterium]|nr:tetratricopeptide repeat protein [Gemmatimonadaceae bacterium]